MAAKREHFLGNFLHQIAIPRLALLMALVFWHLRQATTQNLQCGGERYALWVNLASFCGFVHEHSNDIVTQQKTVNFLNHACRSLAAQHRSFTLMGLDLIKREFLFPTLVVKTDQCLGRIKLRVKQGGEQAMLLPGAARTSRLPDACP